MREFFRGWTRKAGVVTLGLACVLAACWTRSLNYQDSFIFARYPNQLVLTSIDGSFCCRTDGDANVRTLFSKVRWETSESVRLSEVFENTGGLRKWYRHGFGVLTFIDSTWLACVPYWSIVFPLAILSAGLILSQQHAKRKQPVPHA